MSAVVAHRLHSRPYIVTRGVCRALTMIVIISTPVALTLLASAWAGGDPGWTP